MHPPATFDHPELLSILEASALSDSDSLDFGLIVMDRAGTVLGYNSFESKRAGIACERVIGRNFFFEVGPCTNNYLVAQRYTDEPDLDDFVDFVFTLRMTPTPVRLRLLARADSERQYLAVLSR
jgi:photoactive yellow protein